MKLTTKDLASSYFEFSGEIEVAAGSPAHKYLANLYMSQEPSESGAFSEFGFSGRMVAVTMRMAAIGDEIRVCFFMKSTGD